MLVERDMEDQVPRGFLQKTPTAGPATTSCSTARERLAKQA